MLDLVKMCVHSHLELIVLSILRGEIDQACAFVVPYLVARWCSGATRCVYKQIDDAMKNVVCAICLETMFGVEHTWIKRRSLQPVKVLEEAYSSDPHVLRYRANTLAS